MTKKEIEVKCPHCDVTIQIIEVNCAIFRCGQYKNTGKQLNPHASKELCDSVFAQGLIFGCGKPFKLINGLAEKCDYI
jgi:hypothetical protein